MTEAPAPGWYADPDNPQEQRYWDGAHWLAPIVAAEPADEAAEPVSPVAPGELEAGWYRLPWEPTASRYWNGKRLSPGRRASRDGELELPREIAATERARATRQFLWLQYIIGALIPIWGVIAAVYVGVAQKHAAIRRHALGIGAVALIAAGIYTIIFLSGANGRADSAVASDLENLLSDHGVFASNASCAHQSGNQYQCSVTINGQTAFATVTDDGHSIYELGIPAGG